MPREQEEVKALELSVDGVPYRLMEEADLSWLSAYGRVFWVNDQLFSGNLYFGVDGPYGKLLIKYAGARTVNYRGRPSDAVKCLSGAMPLYERKHPALIRLLASGQAGDGYAAIFAWRDAAPLRSLPSQPSARDQVRRLPLHRSLRMLDMVFDLHAALALDGIVAVNFSDESVWIDLGNSEALVTDIDLYRRKPAVNDRGRMWGSSRFMAPEEYVLGASLDESTTLYNMAALAFAFFGDNANRSRESWVGPSPLFEVATIATKESKADRYPSMRSFLDAWRGAVGRCRI